MALEDIVSYSKCPTIWCVREALVRADEPVPRNANLK
jgi:hypothetical protein